MKLPLFRKIRDVTIEYHRLLQPVAELECMVVDIGNSQSSASSSQAHQAASRAREVGNRARSKP